MPPWAALAGRRRLEQLAARLMSPADLFGDVQWEQPARTRPRRAPARTRPRRAPARAPRARVPAGPALAGPSARPAGPAVAAPSARPAGPIVLKPPVAARRSSSAARSRPRRRRPTRRTFLIRRVTALATLGLLVLGVAAAISALGGGSRPGRRAAATSRPAPAGRPAAAAHRSALDQLVALDRTLAPGATGEPVRGLQQTLSVLGISPGPADGVFSDGTRAAVVAFQSAKGLPATGTVDRPTAAALRQALARWALTRSQTIRQGLAAAVAAGRLPAGAAAQDRRILTDAVLRLPRLAPARAALLSAVLADLATQAPVYDRPRALALFGMLDANARRLTTGRLPTRAGADMTGADGTVYRFFPSHGFQFHPLADFARLNRYVTTRQLSRARRLTASLLARAAPDGGGLVWEYYFPYGGPSRWTSALAQSAAAQALIRAGRALQDAAAARAAGAAFAAIPGRLARPLAGGQWVREYSWSDEAILNAQLQSIVSLSEYARTAADQRAAAFIARLAQAARAELPAVDTGSWSRYSIGNPPASRHYHCYHVSLLKQLAALYPGDRVWRLYAARWRRYADARGGCRGA